MLSHKATGFPSVKVITGCHGGTEGRFDLNLRKESSLFRILSPSIIATSKMVRYCPYCAGKLEKLKMLRIKGVDTDTMLSEGMMVCASCDSIFTVFPRQVRLFYRR